MTTFNYAFFKEHFDTFKSSHDEGSNHPENFYIDFYWEFIHGTSLLTEENKTFFISEWEMGGYDELEGKTFEEILDDEIHLGEDITEELVKTNDEVKEKFMSQLFLHISEEWSEEDIKEAIEDIKKEQLAQTITEAESRAFETWYDAKSEETQLLIDEIADRTTYILEEDDYDAFVEELAKIGINNDSDFAGDWCQEVEGHREHVFADFSEQLINDCGYTIEPDFIVDCIDWLKVWETRISKEYLAIEFKENTYFFKKNK